LFLADAERAALRPSLQAQPTACVLLLSKGSDDVAYPLQGALTTIGRYPDRDIVVKDTKVSGYHAEIARTDEGWVLRDLASRNGTTVNGEPAREQRLRSGDRIGVGDTTFCFSDRSFVLAPGARPPSPEGDAGAGEIPPSLEIAGAEVEEAIRNRTPARAAGALDEHRLGILYQVAEALGRPRTESDVLERALDLTLALIPADRACIYLVDPPYAGTGGAPVPAVVRMREGMDGAFAGGISMTVVEKILRERKSVGTSDAFTDPRFCDAESIRDTRIRAVLAAPMMVGEKAIGVLYLDAVATSEIYNRAELLLLSAIAYHAALAVENARIVQQLEARVEERTRQVQSLAHDRMTLLSIAAHDLKTPLAGIMGYLDCLRLRADEEGASPWVSEELGIVGEAAAAMMTLLSDLLDRQKAEAGRLEVHPEITDLGAFLRGSMRIYERWAEAVSRTAHLRVADGLPPVWIDHTRVTQILNNLVHNALKHTPKGSRVVIEARAVEGAQIEISVTDEGKGFDAADSDRILMFFDRGTKQEAEVGHGHGLGLAIVDKLVALHGGLLRVDSRPGAGAKFAFTLPVGMACASPLAAAARSALEAVQLRRPDTGGRPPSGPGRSPGPRRKAPSDARAVRAP